MFLASTHFAAAASRPIGAVLLVRPVVGRALHDEQAERTDLDDGGGAHRGLGAAEDAARVAEAPVAEPRDPGLDPERLAPARVDAVADLERRRRPRRRRDRPRPRPGRRPWRARARSPRPRAGRRRRRCCRRPRRRPVVSAVLSSRTGPPVDPPAPRARPRRPRRCSTRNSCAACPSMRAPGARASVRASAGSPSAMTSVPQPISGDVDVGADVEGRHGEDAGLPLERASLAFQAREGSVAEGRRVEGGQDHRQAHPRRSPGAISPRTVRRRRRAARSPVGEAVVVRIVLVANDRGRRSRPCGR